MLTFPLDLLVALGLGLLVGLEREWSTDEVAGIRTFPLITLLGFLSAELAVPFGGWVPAAAFISLAAMVVVGNLVKARSGRFDWGVTTEVAILVMFGVGAALAAGFTTVAVVVGGAVPVLLHWKAPMERFARQLGEADFRAIMRLVLIALVILPVLPNRSFGPLGVLNPFQIWLMVVLIVGISLAAYIAYRLLGAGRGTVVAGLLGGLISSTAATVGYARQGRESEGQGGTETALILIASTVVFGRVLLELAVVSQAHLAVAGPPLGAMMAVMGLIAAAAYLTGRESIEGEADRHEPSSDLKAAILFGLIYGVVLFAVAAARRWLGPGGLYAVAGLSGLTDMDAITLSTAQLVRSGELDAALGWRLILVGALANLGFKTSIVAVVGGRRLFKRVMPLMAVGFVAGGAILLLWPD